MSIGSPFPPLIRAADRIRTKIIARPFEPR